MKNVTPGIRTLYLGAIVLCVVLSLTGARGQGKEAGSLKFGVVNVGKVLNGYKLAAKSEADLNKLQDDIVTELRSWDQHQLLTEADQRTLGLIAVQELHQVVLSGADKATKTRMEEKNTKLVNELSGLQILQNPTPADVTRLKELSKVGTETGKRIKDRQLTEQQNVQKQASDMRTKIQNDVNTAIAEFAKSKGYNLVFTSEVLLYCDNDLTDEVLKKLNK